MNREHAITYRVFDRESRIEREVAMSISEIERAVLPEIIQQIHERYDQGIVEIRAYSADAPDGEHGMIHLSHIKPISEAGFDYSLVTYRVTRAFENGEISRDEADEICQRAATRWRDAENRQGQPEAH